ncbi:ComF family protein [Spartinivicinus ruber]|uniref:ComF family protein n=1 Tax=Spartinivicinus ruber TaxID=2683272 RepID=UPI0013D6EBA5|nr:ComF family protein [Spartinivicinus ruber]
MVYKWIKSNLSLPHYCWLCQAPCDAYHRLCLDCIKQLPRIKYPCRLCAEPLPVETEDMICGRCYTQPPKFDQCLPAFCYSFPVDHMIHQFKFNGKLICGQALTYLLSEKLNQDYLNQPWPELIIPTPLHRKRELQRGFNQALLIAKQLSKQLKIPLHSRLIHRHKKTSAQTGLSAKERHVNIRYAFQLTCQSLPNHLALIDDVVTTGTTVNEISQLLKKSGVQKVDIWCLAKTPKWR